MAARYDEIGSTYHRHRRPDPRIATAIEAALGGARSVVNVGAGTGSYEPGDRRLVAVEPSLEMIRKRPPGSAPVVRAVAERLPFPDGAFDAALAVLTVHHWTDHRAGLSELRRVAVRQLVLTWDRSVFARFWLGDYLPELVAHEERLVTLDAVTAALHSVDVRPVPVPWDCTDGFGGAYWRRPERYLDPQTREAISALAMLDQAVVSRAMERLERDLADGTWARRYGRLLSLEELDLGYRLVVARAGGSV